MAKYLAHCDAIDRFPDKAGGQRQTVASKRLPIYDMQAYYLGQAPEDADFGAPTGSSRSPVAFSFRPPDM